MSDKVAACPECDTHRIRCNSGTDMHDWRDAPAYRCRDCKAPFEEPVLREPRNNQKGNLTGLVKRLDKADPGEVCAE